MLVETGAFYYNLVFKNDETCRHWAGWKSKNLAQWNENHKILSSAF